MANFEGKDPYEVLGLQEDASEDDIRHAFKRNASRVHPDRKGDPNEFHMVVWAKDVLSDAKRRAYYDKNRVDPDEKDRKASILGNLAGVISDVLDEVDDADYVDVARLVVGRIQRGIQNLQQQKKGLERKIKQREKALKRFTTRSPKMENHFAVLIEGDLRHKKGELAEVEQGLEVATEMIRITREHKYETEFQSPAQFRSFFPGSAG